MLNRNVCIWDSEFFLKIEKISLKQQLYRPSVDIIMPNTESVLLFQVYHFLFSRQKQRKVNNISTIDKNTLCGWSFMWSCKIRKL